MELEFQSNTISSRDENALKGSKEMEVRKEKCLEIKYKKKLSGEKELTGVFAFKKTLSALYFKLSSSVKIE
jgi:hypothetical protein